MQRKLGERVGERPAGREPLLDFVIAVVRGEVERQAQLQTGTGLDPITPRRLAEHVPRDAEQPWERRTIALVAEPAAAEPGLREGLGGQIGGSPLEPATEPRIDGQRVAAVELSEDRRVGRPAHELRVGSIGHTPPWRNAAVLYPLTVIAPGLDDAQVFFARLRETRGGSSGCFG